jgi:fatty acid desaturase
MNECPREDEFLARWRSTLVPILTIFAILAFLATVILLVAAIWLPSWQAGLTAVVAGAVGALAFVAGLFVEAEYGN